MLRRALLVGNVWMGLLLLTACARATASSVRRAGYEDARFQRVMVWALISDLELRRAFEEHVIDVRPESFVAGTSILFPARAYTEEEVGQELRRAGVDAVLTIEVGDVGSGVSGYVPGTVQNFDGVLVSTPPRPVTTSSVQFHATLTAVRDGEPVWTATSSARGSGTSSGPSELVRVAARRLAWELEASDILYEHRPR